MQDITRDLFVSLAAFASIFGVIYVYLSTRHRERMSMLEKGTDPGSFSGNGKGTSYTLKAGMLGIGMSVGILLGNVLYNSMNMTRSVAFTSMIFLFGGISLVVNFVIDRKLKI